MIYIWKYDIPLELDNMLMSSDDKYLTGYDGGIKNKVALLAHEKNDTSKYFISKKGSVYDKV